MVIFLLWSRNLFWKQEFHKLSSATFYHDHDAIWLMDHKKSTDIDTACTLLGKNLRQIFVNYMTHRVVYLFHSKWPIKQGISTTQDVVSSLFQPCWVIFVRYNIAFVLGTSYLSESVICLIIRLRWNYQLFFSWTGMAAWPLQGQSLLLWLIAVSGMQ